MVNIIASLTRVPGQLDLDDWNFRQWEFFFEELCASYEVDKYLRSPINETSACSLTLLTPEETKVDKIVLSWTLFTLFDSLRARIVVARPKSSKEAWSLISDVVKDNKRSRTCTIEVLLRCDSTGDLYLVTAPSPIPHAFVVSQHMWHRRLGYPGSDVLRRLVSNNVISCNKEKPPVLCHACQLGKHVRLSFVSSNTIASSCFDIVHSDVWTSPIPSLSATMFALNLSVKFMLFNVIMVVNSTTVTFMTFSTLMPSNSVFHALRHLNKMVNLNVWYAHLTTLFGLDFFKQNFHQLIGLRPFIWPFTSLRFYPPHLLTMKSPLPAFLALHLTIVSCVLLDAYATPTPSLFLGHASNHRGYRCLDLTTTKIIISRHVTFDETVFPYGSTPSTTVPSYTFLDEPDINPPSVSVSTFQPPVHEPTTPPTSPTLVAHLLSPTA
ncbi:ribonuclease H-like domain-containing protein [Tanacetum coccineum]